MKKELFKEKLLQGMLQLDLDITDQQTEQSWNYLNLLMKWNRVYNLTAVRNIEQMLVMHLFDSLSILPIVQTLQRQSWIDVGTGAGLPGIPLAIMSPDESITLLDSQAKRIHFLMQVKMALHIKNIAIEQSIANDFQPEMQYGIVLTRAFASLMEMVKQTAHLCAENGYFVAMKGQYPHDELAELPQNLVVLQIIKLNVPFLDAERHLVILQKQGILGS